MRLIPVSMLGAAVLILGSGLGAPRAQGDEFPAVSDTAATYLTTVPRLHLELDYGGLSPANPRVDLRDRLGLRPHMVEMSRYQCSILGADRGAYGALWVGTLGSWLGLWDEDTALMMTAAGAALGGLWGGTAGNASLDFRMRPVWDDR